MLVPILIGCVVSYFSQNPASISFYSGWGKEYKDVLGLTDEEQFLLNSLSREAVFSKYKYNYDSIFFYRLEVVRTFISALRSLDYENRSNEKAKNICLYCDYLLSEKYLFQRYDNDVFEISKVNESLAEYEKIKIKELCQNARSFTDEEEKKLFIFDIKRRDYCYDRIIEEYEDSNQFYEDIKRLEALNEAFTVKRNFYYKAYRFMIEKDKLISLKLYIHYLSINPNSTTNLSISKPNLKKIFEKESQKINFEKIVDQFKVDKNLEKALFAVDNIFVVTRKRVNLNVDAINSATEDLNSVVEVLNKYLEDEVEEPIRVKEQEIEIKNTGKSEMSLIQTEFIDFFISKSYKLNNSEIDTFANSKGVFKSQLIDGFNEKYFDQLDDFLIEEVDDYFVLNKDYYRQITRA